MQGVDLEVNDLIRDPVKGTVKARGTGRLQHLPCDMVLGSIGYCSLPMPGMPFDKARGIIPNRWDLNSSFMRLTCPPLRPVVGSSA